MNTAPLIFWESPDTRPPVTIRTRGRNMLLRTLDGTMAHVDAGTEITVDAAVLDGLDQADYVLAPTD